MKEGKIMEKYGIVWLFIERKNGGEARRRLLLGGARFEANSFKNLRRVEIGVIRRYAKRELFGKIYQKFENRV